MSEITDELINWLADWLTNQVTQSGEHIAKSIFKQI